MVQTIEAIVKETAKIGDTEFKYPPFTQATEFLAVQAVKKWQQDRSNPVVIGVETIEGERSEVRLTEETNAEIITTVYPQLEPIFGDVKL